ncbi:MAG: trypsin-like serine protease [Sandaracinaceae bacterium]
MRRFARALPPVVLVLLTASGLAAAVGCAAPTEEPPAASSAAIVNGELGGNPAVVVLQNFASGGLCTGALIAERVVLTAKHCVQEAFAEGPVAPSQMVVGIGNSTSQVSQVLRVQSIDTPPGVYTTRQGGSIGDGLVGEDVAVIVLQTGAAGIEPLPIRRETHTTLTGQTITAIGYGQTPSGQVGVKFTTTGRVQGTDARLIYVGAITCQGDSGGPAITADGEIAGVVSFGAGSCGTGYGAYNAITPYFEMIDAALSEAGSCLNDGAERCDGADNDCDDLVDETCSAIGESCAQDSECVGQTCRDTSAGQICTAECDPLRPDFGCDPGLYCARTDGCNGLCLPIGTGDQSLTLGTACTADSQCESLYCADPGDGNMRCLQSCRGDTGMCLAGEACAANPGDCGGCVAEEILRADRGLGESCEVGADCRSGACFEDAGRRYCSRSCEADPDCPDAFHCRDMACVAGPRGDIGEPCASNGDCVMGTFCATRGSQSWCTRVCDTEECPDGFACVEAGGTQVCAPDRGLLGDACTGNADCITNSCAVSGGVGSCTRECSSDAPCAPGFECRRISAGSATAVCVAPEGETDGGGCNVSPKRGAPFAGVFVLFGAVALLVRRRR